METRKFDNPLHHAAACAAGFLLIWACSLQPAFSFYDPSTGRWLSRDPSEERAGRSLYGLLANQPTSQVDRLGLDKAQIEVGRAIVHYVEDIKRTEIAKVSGIGDATEKLLSVLGSISIAVDPSHIPAGATAAYVPWTHTMYLPTGPVEGRDATHETVHAYNDRNGTPATSPDRRDEGTAYAYTGLIEGPIGFAARLEKLIAESKDCPDRKIVTGYWQGLLWKRFASPESISGVTVHNVLFPDTHSRTDATDIRLVRWVFGLHASCKDYADVLNRLLESKNCCFRVTCAPSGSENEIPALADIDSVFK